MKEVNFPFRVEEACRDELIRGLGHKGRRETIVKWESIGYKRGCPDCGYDRVRKIVDYNWESHRERHECNACGLKKERFEEAREKAAERGLQDALDNAPSEIE